MSSIKLLNRMNTIFMNSDKSQTSDPHRLLSGKYVALSKVSIYFTWKNIKKSHKNNKFKISAMK